MKNTKIVEPVAASVKKVFLKISLNSQENTCARVLFLIRSQAWACSFIKKEALARVFSCEFYEISKNNSAYNLISKDSGIGVFLWIYEISKNTFCHRTPLVAASERSI